MLTIYKSDEQGKLLTVGAVEHNTLVHMVNPSEEEINNISNTLNIPKEFFLDSLDKNERPRITKEKDSLLIVLNVPTVIDNVYKTVPIGLIHTKDNTVLVSRHELEIFTGLLAGQHGQYSTFMKTRLSLLLFKAIANSYNQYLVKINEEISKLQRELKASYRNQELFGLIDLNKSLVFFSTSLNAMSILYKRIMQGHDIKIHDEEKKRLQDILVDIEQATEVTEMRRESLSNLMDAYAAIIHNNLNSVLKMLTTLAIIMTIPTMIGSVFSMNVDLPYEEEWISTIVVGIGMVIISVMLLVIFYKKKYLRI